MLFRFCMLLISSSSKTVICIIYIASTTCWSTKLHPSIYTTAYHCGMLINANVRCSCKSCSSVSSTRYCSEGTCLHISTTFQNASQRSTTFIHKPDYICCLEQQYTLQTHTSLSPLFRKQKTLNTCSHVLNISKTFCIIINTC